MHHHPRAPPTTASPASSEQTNPIRTNNPRDRDVQHLRSTSTPGSVTSEDFVNTRQEPSSDNPTAQMQRLNQVIQNFHTKAALIILSSRVDLPPAFSSKNSEKRVNRWFNIELDETEEYAEDIRRWRKTDLNNDRPPPLVIEVYLTTEGLAQGQRLVILDDEERRWDVANALQTTQSGKSHRRNTHSNEVLLERWTIELGASTSSTMPSDLGATLPLVYKKSIVLFRSLYTYCNFLPAWKLSRKVGRSRANMSMKLGYRILDGSRMNETTRPDNLNIPLCDTTSDVTINYTFGETESPAGPFSVKVQYRENCDFRIDDSEELLSSRFMGGDDSLFKPSLPNDDPLQSERQAAQPGSLPSDRRQHLIQRPELGHAYGSMSTFHQAGFGAGTSPISALRSARELGDQSPSPEPVRPLLQTASSAQSQRNTLRAAAAGRRSSFSFQPFKAPALSASPLGASPLGTSPRTLSARGPALSSLTEERPLPSPNAQAVAARKSGSLGSDPTIPISPSSSPKPQPVRYSSSFSHRRARLSAGGGTGKPDEDQSSSGRASATSSAAAPPGSGLLAEPAGTGTSSGSMQEDDENISDFLKMLDLKKDLLAPADAAASEASNRRTAAALNKFHRMRDSNAALSDSMHSSLTLQRPQTSSSRQISSSTSPNKPTSPHTPHTPFAPSRLSAAYSHDDEERQQLEREQEEAQVSADTSADAAQAGNVPAIDIPSSPRPLLPSYRRSNSAQRRPLSSDEDLADMFGLRSTSMDTHERKNIRRNGTATEVEAHAAGGPTAARTAASPVRSSINQRLTEAVSTNDGLLDGGSNRSPANNVYRSRLARNSSLRGVTPPQGSTSSFGGTGGSLERGGDSGGSASGSWGGRGGRFRSGSRPDNRFSNGNDELDAEEEFLPFAMEKSDFNQGISER